MRRVALALTALLALSAVAQESACLESDLSAQKSEAPAQPSGKADKKGDEACKDRKKDNVGVLDWALGSHRAPSFHFIDIVELFLR